MCHVNHLMDSGIALLLDHRPLTVLQLQKDVSHDTEKLQKSQILKKLVNINRNYYGSKVDNVTFVTNGGSI